MAASNYVPSESECKRIVATVRDGARPRDAIRYVIGMDLDLKSLPVLAIAITAAEDQLEKALLDLSVRPSS